LKEQKNGWYSLKPETALVRKQQGTSITWNHAVTNNTSISQKKYFKKAIELGLSMDMD
jgi:hypothetical protein